MRVKFAVVLVIVAPMSGLIGRAASGAEAAPKKAESTAADDAQEKAIKELQGEWQVVRRESNGQRSDNIQPPDRMVVKGHEIEFLGSRNLFTFTLDPSKTPAEIDLTLASVKEKGKPVAGIYSLKEGRLTICLCGGPKRPAEFKTKQNDNCELAVSERVADVGPRKWLDKTGKHETTAKYFGQSASGVRLARADGKIITVPLDKLSDVDRQYVEARRRLEAEDRAGQVIKPRDNRVETEMKRASELFAAGKTDEAIYHYNAAMVINPNSAEAHDGLGRALVKNGRMDEADAHYRAALQIKPDYAEAYNDLGVVLMKRGLTREATALFQKALQIKPSYAEAKENLEKAKKAAPAGK